MEGHNRGDGVLPRRNSAKRATATFAGQLHSDSADSPRGGSESEAESSTWKGRAAVKEKYGKRAKMRKRSVSVKEAVGQESNKIRFPSPSEDLVAPRPKSRPSAPVPTSTSEQPPRPRPRPRPIVKRPPPPPPVTAPPPPREESDLSDLTPLSSDERSSSSEVVSTKDTQNPLLFLSAPAPLTSRLSHNSHFNPQAQRKELVWTVATLTTYVWVLIEPQSSRVYDQEEDGDDNMEGLWWPGKITSPRMSDVPLKIKLFGTGAKTVLLFAPSEENILSRLDRHFRPRFLKPTFVSPPSLSVASPRKKQKRDRSDIEKRWQAAVDEMRLDGQDVDSDDLPEVGDMFNYLTTPSSSNPVSAPLKLSYRETKGKRKRKFGSDISAEEDNGVYADKEEVPWEPPPLDEDLEIPGELVLAREKAATTMDYWPGKLTQYIPPSTQKQQAKFKIVWLDGTNAQIPRSWFYTMQEDGFATCKLGQFISTVVEVQNDGEDDEKIQLQDNLARRSPSPVPLDPPPSATDFLQLSIREQFVYTKNILKAILNNEYEPSRHKHTRYMNGGKQRQSVVDDASLRGRMDPQDVEHLQTYIREWCLRDEGRAGTLIVDDVPTDEPTVIDLVEEEKANIKEERRHFTVQESSDDVMESDNKRFPSPLPTEGFPSSPPEIPPSSCPSSRIEREASIRSDTPSFPSASDAYVPPLSPVASSIVATEPLTATTSDGANEDTSDLTGLEDDPTVLESTTLSRQRGCKDFESLSPLGKVDYCVNVLLPEAVRQILLWRTGARTSMELLSPAEEQTLYEQGDTLLQERDWVNDIMRYREMMRKGLKSKNVSQTRKTHGRTDSASRLRRNVVIPNYQE
ncbi:hypothetical protein BDZ97DRAFT_1794071 [Flammula alnicola]|nr:hypothetical protein BDZ97DRAFT_1794071 [Flammula alnicola]